MAEASSELEGPDFEKGYETGNVRDGEMLLGHAFGEPVLVARRGDDAFRHRRNVHALRRTAGERSDGRLHGALSVASCAIRFADRRSNRSARLE